MLTKLEFISEITSDNLNHICIIDEEKIKKHQDMLKIDRAEDQHFEKTIMVLEVIYECTITHVTTKNNHYCIIDNHYYIIEFKNQFNENNRHN